MLTGRRVELRNGDGGRIHTNNLQTDTMDHNKCVSRDADTIWMLIYY